MLCNATHALASVATTTVIDAPVLSDTIRPLDPLADDWPVATSLLRRFVQRGF